MHQVAPGDIEAFVAERCVDLRCPACGGARIGPAAECQGKPIALLYEDSAAQSWFGPPGYLSVLALTCADCSYVLIFHLDALQKWIRARRARAGASPSRAATEGELGAGARPASAAPR
jgi:hypothetical protein